MVAREKKEMKPLTLKLGATLVLSFVGFLYNRFRTRRIRSTSTAAPSSAPSSEIDSRGIECGPKDEVHASEIASCSTSPTEKYQVDSTVLGLSLLDSHNGEKDGTLLSEFDELLKEVDFDNEPTPKISVKEDDYEQEVKHLKNTVKTLKERERNLEVQLLEYYGLKEQEKTAMELENRLRISNMEAKLLRLKIESLQASNQRLEAQVADHAKAMAELEAAKGKTMLLKRKLRHEAEQNRENILSLQERVAKLRDQSGGSDDSEVQSKLERMNELEDEAKELRAANLRLQLENADLGQRLESTQILATSVLEDAEAMELKKVTDDLKQENENLMKKIETLQADRCGDVEELVYLRWLNACLRFEMRNYQPPTGKTVAKDLSRKLSPKSEDKAKQLILEYASAEDFDSDRWSNTELDFSDESPSTQKPKSKKHRRLFKKLKSLIKGKDGDHHDHRMEDSDSLYSTGTSDQGHSGRFTSPPRRIKTIPDIPRFRSPKDSEIINARSSNRDNRYKRGASVDLGKELDHHHREFVAEKADLVKHAEALKDSTTTRPSSRDKRHDFGRRASVDLGKELDDHRREFVAEKADLVKYAEALKGQGWRRSASYSSLTLC